MIEPQKNKRKLNREECVERLNVVLSLFKENDTFTYTTFRSLLKNCSSGSILGILNHLINTKRIIATQPYYNYIVKSVKPIIVEEIINYNIKKKKLLKSPIEIECTENPSERLNFNYKEEIKHTISFDVSRCESYEYKCVLTISDLCKRLPELVYNHIIAKQNNIPSSSSSSSSDINKWILEDSGLVPELKKSNIDVVNIKLGQIIYS